MSDQTVPRYQAIASSVQAYLNCMDRVERNTRTSNRSAAWAAVHEDRIRKHVEDMGIRGSGFDAGISLDLTKSTGQRLVFNVPYHAMNADGFYTGWYDWTVVVKADLVHGISLTFKGKKANESADYVIELFHNSLTEHVNPWTAAAVAV